MCIDVDARWPGMTKEVQAAQTAGFTTTSGRLGHLREDDNGPLYATFVLVPEAFTQVSEIDGGDGVMITARTLRERLPTAIATAIWREAILYDNSHRQPETRAVLESMEEFVAFCEAKEAATGEPCNIIANY